MRDPVTTISPDPAPSSESAVDSCAIASEGNIAIESAEIEVMIGFENDFLRSLNVFCISTLPI
ncbi:MAG: hypothetical protein ABL928_02005 [Sphingorhabdus sp.]